MRRSERGIVTDMAEGPTIRRATVNDAEDFAACLDAAYGAFAESIPDLPDMSAVAADEIANSLVWVAETDNRIVGALVLSPADHFMMLVNVAVHPDARGTGLGMRLMTLAETEAMARGLRELRLATHRDMTDTIALYQRTGWVETGRIGSKIKMRKALPA